jgi:hypothetical protein
MEVKIQIKDRQIQAHFMADAQIFTASKFGIYLTSTLIEAVHSAVNLIARHISTDQKGDHQNDEERGKKHHQPSSNVP